LALPSFAVQTGQPCAACHVGAWGPQLKKAGRDFKLFGYSAEDQTHDLPPVALLVNGGFTHTEADQPGGAGPHLGRNDIVNLENASLYYAGRFNSESGAFIELAYEGATRNLGPGEVDIRYAHDTDLQDTDIVYGLTLNDDPTVSDIFNSTPVWGFPYLASTVAPTPNAATLIDGGLSQQVAGAGAYLMWNDFAYLEVTLYKGLGRDVRNALGVVPVAGTDSVDGVAPYWRLALQRYFDDDRQFAEIGTFGISASKFPGGLKTEGPDRYLDIGVDANYQWIADTRRVTSDVISAHASYIHEDLKLDASRILGGTNPSDNLSTIQANLSYAIGATYTPTVQYFRSWGSNDPSQWGIPSGSPNSAGWIAELNLVPWGKPDSPLNWLNGRLLLQYVGYTRFNGDTAHASDHNVIFIDLSIALALNR
jgi:hypothetical protein